MRLFVLALVLLPQFAIAHGGGLNAEGCHNNRKTGDYHCHRAPNVERTPSRNDTISRPQRTAPGAREPRTVPIGGGPTCFVGPRGGTYTITPSGRKNYSGC